MDGDLEGMDRELVQAHLEHCDPCRSVAVTLGWLEPLLPGMAEIDPGPAFTARVLAQTTGRAQSRGRVPAVPTGRGRPDGPGGHAGGTGRSCVPGSRPRWPTRRRWSWSC